MIRMSVLPVLFALLLSGSSLAAQATGTVTGRVVSAATQQPIGGANVSVVGTGRGGQTSADGRFTITAVPTGSRRVVASAAGYSQGEQPATVTAGASVSVDIALSQQVVQLEGVVAIGYGTQRREAVTGSVATITTDVANVGQVAAATELLQGRVAGVQMVQNGGSPGSGVQVRIRGGTSISASNDPLYVIDGVPINNVPIEPTSLGQNNSLPRNPLSLINPNDIESLTVLKDASATAIYGSRGANGVVLITTKQGRAGRVELTYDGSYSTAAPVRSLDVLDGDEYRAFIEGEIAAGRLAASRRASLGTANTRWEDEVLRNANSHNHNLAFAGGTSATQYRGSLSYSNEEGIVRSSGLERVSGRINANQHAWNGRLRLGLNLNASQARNDYVASENTGGFTGTVFTNTLIMNPTHPVTVTDPETGVTRYFEIGQGAVTIRNPVAIAEQVLDDGISRRILGNMTVDLDLLENLTAQLNVGTDRSNGVRRAYYPKISPLGAETNGQALVGTIDNTNNTFQSYLTYRLSPSVHEVDVLAGYEYNDYSTAATNVEARSFPTDAFSYNNLGAGGVQQPSSSSRNDSKLVSFFGRANYNLADRYFLTGVLRYDGSSRFGAGNKWALFPSISGAWLVSNEPFMENGPFSALRLKAGFGVNGSQEIAPYSSLITLNPGARAVFGEQTVLGVAPNRNPNPNLKWEQTAQWNVGLDWGVLDNRLTGTLEYYDKSTSDLLLTVPVPQPAVEATRLENVGEVRNRGVEFTLDAEAYSNSDLTVVLGLIGSVDRNEVVSLGNAAFIATGSVSGQGQSGVNSQRIIPGYPIGTFYGAEFVGIDPAGKQLFNKYTVTRDARGNITSRTLAGQTTTPTPDDLNIIGDANPDYTLSARGQVNWGDFDLNLLVRGVFGQEMLNNTALVYATKGNALQNKNFLKAALDDATGITEPAIYSSRWIEDASFVRFQTVTLGYNLPAQRIWSQANAARVYLSAENLFLISDYSGPDPEVNTGAGLASRGIDYLTYPNPRTVTVGVRLGF